MKRLLLLVLTLAFAAGCKLVERLPRFQELPAAQTTASQYHLEGWDWKGVSRVLVLPLRNESAYTRSGEEMQAALTSELQRLGRFEVVAATPEHLQRLSTGVHQNGVFGWRSVAAPIVGLTQACPSEPKSFVQSNRRLEREYGQAIATRVARMRASRP